MLASFVTVFLLFSALKAEASKEESKVELSSIFDPIQLRMENYAAFIKTGAKMPTIALPSSPAEKKSLRSVQAYAPFYVVKGMYSDNDCGNLVGAVGVLYGACMPFAGALWTSTTVDEDVINTGFYSDSRCQTVALPPTSSPFEDDCVMGTKTYLSSPKEYAGSTEGVKGSTHFGYNPSLKYEIVFAQTETCLLGSTKIFHSGTSVSVTMYMEDNCTGTGTTITYDTSSCISLPFEDYFFCFDV